MTSDVSASSRWLRQISNVALWLGAAALLLLAAVIVVAALARIFNTAVVGASEIVDVAIIVVASMALVAGTASDAHPSVHILTSRLSKGRQKTLKVFAQLLALGFFAVLCYESAIVLVHYAALGEYTQLLRIDITPFRALWVFSLAAICIVLTLRAWLIRHDVDTKN